MLAVLDVAAGLATWSVASVHLTVVLLCAFTVYAVRDVWPLVTFTTEPIDVHEGVFLWITIMLLGIAGVIVPLCIPRQYIPISDGEVCSQPVPHSCLSDE